MVVVRVIFDGNVFVPQEPITLPVQSEGVVMLKGDSNAAQQEPEDAVRAYYRGGTDADDEAWGKATTPQSHRAWDDVAGDASPAPSPGTPGEGWGEG